MVRKKWNPFAAKTAKKLATGAATDTSDAQGAGIAEGLSESLLREVKADAATHPDDGRINEIEKQLDEKEAQGFMKRISRLATGMVHIGTLRLDPPTLDAGPLPRFSLANSGVVDKGTWRGDVKLEFCKTGGNKN